MRLIEAIESINLYVKKGWPTGGFLRAVLANDLMGAMSRADLQSRECLFDIASYIYNKVPMDAWGSYAIVNAWKGTDKMDDKDWQDAAKLKRRTHK